MELVIADSSGQSIKKKSSQDGFQELDVGEAYKHFSSLPNNGLGVL